MNKFHISLFLTLTLSLISLREVSSVIPKSSYNEVFKDETVHNIQSNGSICIESCLVKEQVLVNGSLTICESKIGDIFLNGHLQVTNSRINSAQINGSISASNSQFLGVISVASDDVVLEDCTAHNLLIRKTGNSNTVQTVQLTGSTEIKKNIRFEVPGGRVILSPESKISGQVINGVGVNQ
jgi:hypothetical protein